jgi:hypothetical protein
MGTTYRFIERPGLPSQVIEWFRSCKQPTEEVPTNRGHAFHFTACGGLSRDGEGAIDPKNSPVVTVFLPRVIRGALWTVGEVHFLATPLRERFPVLHKVNAQFAKWLLQSECVFSNKPGGASKWNYYLEGSTRNFDPPIYGLPSGLSALQDGRYFVGDDDPPIVIEKLCSALRLRGVETDADA